jgi:hypothetical protein
VGLSLVGYLAGIRVQRLAALALALCILAQQCGAGAMQIEATRRSMWWTTLAQPGDAIRQRLVLPSPDSRDWQRAWSRAAQAAVLLCTYDPAPPAAGVTVLLGSAPAGSLADLTRTSTPDGWGWYALPVTESALARRLTPLPSRADRSALDIELQHGGTGSGMVRVCGGRDDPARPDAGGALRKVGAEWTSAQVADTPLPLVNGKPPLSRYHFEVRLYAADGLPHVAIWY